MPIPQRVTFIVEQVFWVIHRQDACSTKSDFYCGTGILGHTQARCLFHKE
ncbi:MAG: hypothetical protein QQW96_19005 [Tychonema bourrellyi B0820]|nr:hypothetical protein [Tychonema bourrellyi B0820]